MNITTYIDKYKQLILQLIKFCFVGVINTGTSLGVYYIVLFVGLHYLIANTIGFLVSVLVAYILNKRFVFKSDAKTGSSLAKTYVTYGFTFILSNILLVVFIDVLKISDVLAPLITTVLNIPINFLLIKFWAMK